MCFGGGGGGFGIGGRARDRMLWVNRNVNE